MAFYILLTGSTLLIGLLGFLIWHRTRSVGFVLGLGLIYYWTLFGAWRVVSQNLEVHQETSLYLYDKLFPIYLDEDYFWSLTLYSLFVLALQLTILLCLHRYRHQEEWDFPPIGISHATILAVGGTLGLVGILLVRDSLPSGLEAWSYANLRSAPFYKAHQILIQAALSQLAIGLGIVLTGRQGRFLVGRLNFKILVGYGTVFSATMAVALLTGSRGATALTFLLVVMVYLTNSRRTNKIMIGCLSGIGLVTVSIAKAMQGGTLASGAESWWKAFSPTVSTLWSTEAFAAHFSMYGALHHNIPWVYGWSILSLIASLVPRALWPSRPGDVYLHYVLAVGAIDGQGYTIHHATGWYLNFGLVGVILGGAVIGWIWATLFKRMRDFGRWRSQWVAIFSILAFSTFTSAIPILLRSGLESYKAIVTDFFLVPTFFITLASARMVMRFNRPRLIFPRSPSGIPNQRLSGTIASSTGRGSRHEYDRIH